MKKTYINPTTDEITLNMAHPLLTVSTIQFDDAGGGTIELNGKDPDGDVMAPSFTDF